MMVQSKGYKIVQTDITGLHYFKKVMKTKSNYIYYAHIFFMEPMTASKLKSQWKEITSIVAVQYQSYVEDFIERSNFYLFFYVDGELDDSLRETIEENEFCARKYLIQEAYTDEESSISNINTKLFSFASKGLILGAENPIHVNKLVLHNFRIYENERTFDFTCPDNKSSSFVLIYAKNGVGKTSIFDGVEFLLKGEVNRISALQKRNDKSVTPEIMLHNINNPDADSFVSAILSNDEPLLRKVQKNAKDDLRQSVPSKGKNFIGVGSDQRKWQEIILPHDSIDGYTMINTPEKTYKDWITQSNLEEDSNSFKSKNKEQKQINKLVSEICNQLDDVEGKLNELNGDRSAIEEIIKLIDLFNKKKSELDFPEGDELYLSFDAEIQAYDSLVNASKSFIHLIDTCVREQVKPEKEKLETIQNHGQEYYDRKHQEYVSLKARQKEFQCKMVSRKKLEEVMETISAISNEKTKCNKELQIVETIILRGGANEIRNKSDRILELQQKSTIYQEAIAEKKADLDQHETSLQKMKASIHALQESVSDEDKYKAIMDVAMHYETVNAMLSNVLISLDRNKSELEILERSIDQKAKENKIAFINLPQNLSEVDFDMVQSCGELIGFSKVKFLLSLVNEYGSVQSEIKSLEQQIQEGSKNKGELDIIIHQATTYIAKHQERCECPVCGKEFESNDKLYKAIINNSNLYHKSLIESLQKSQTQLLLLDEQYTKNVESIRDELDEIIKAATKSLTKMRLDYEEKKKNINHLLELKLKGEMELEKPGAILCKYGEDYKQDPVGIVEQWYTGKRAELKIQEEQFGKLQTEEEELSKELVKKKVLLEKSQQDLEILNDDYKLQQAIIFIKDKEREWSAEEEEIRIKAKLKDLNTRYDDLKREELGYSEVKNLSSEFISGQINNCEERLSGLQMDENIFTKYFGLNKSCLIEDLKRLERTECNLREEQDILQKILDENSARNFFEGYGKTLEEKKRLIELLSAQKKKAEKCQFEKDDMREKLEKKLKEHFDQTIMNIVYSKIDPHRIMKDVKYTIEFSANDEPQLYITASDGVSDIRPEWYFSTAQLNTLAFSSFFSRALKSELKLKTIFIDDPIAHFDDMNILGFVDLMRCLIMETPFQFIMSTHDRKIYEIMKRKLPEDYYRAKYIEL